MFQWPLEPCRVGKPMSHMSSSDSNNEVNKNWPHFPLREDVLTQNKEIYSLPSFAIHTVLQSTAGERSSVKKRLSGAFLIECAINSNRLSRRQMFCECFCGSFSRSMVLPMSITGPFIDPFSLTCYFGLVFV